MQDAHQFHRFLPQFLNSKAMFLPLVKGLVSPQFRRHFGVGRQGVGVGNAQLARCFAFGLGVIINPVFGHDAGGGTGNQLAQLGVAAAQGFGAA